jgi:hypothetical protein
MADGARRTSRRSRHTRQAARSVGLAALAVLVLGLVLWPTLTATAQPPAPAGSPAAPPAPSPAPAVPPDQPPPPQPPPPPTEVNAQPLPVSPTAPLHFEFKIDPKTPLKDLLPAAPKVTKAPGPFLAEDLAAVPEVRFQAPQSRDVANQEATRETAYLIARINHLNGKKTDGFLLALTGERADLAGLPFAMGEACRTKGERSRHFAQAVASVRQALRGLQATAFTAPSVVAGVAAAVPGGSASVRQVIANSAPAFAVAANNEPGTASDTFWEQYRSICGQEDRTLDRVDRDRREHVTVARIAALTQVLAPETASMRLGLVEYLAGVSHVEATKALARLALFSPEDEVREAAVEALKVRRDRDYTGILEDGLHYPLPAVAKRAAEAIVKLERTDLLPRLVALLEDPDPRAPAVKEVNSRQVSVVRELVRINHHQSCLLCHAPANTGRVAPETLTAAVPNPTEPLSVPSQGYGQAVSPDVTVRIDVTYLRQDFSVLQPVTDANPWPEMQRFDFLVRTRTLTEDEARIYRAKFEQREPGRPSAYQRVALAALREMTGKDAEPTPEAWRRLLKLSAER